MARRTRHRSDLGRAVMVRHFPGRLGRDRVKQAQTDHRISGKAGLRRKR